MPAVSPRIEQPEQMPTEQEDNNMAEQARRMDPELRAMAAMLRMLTDLSPPTRRRVVAWLSDRFREVGRENSRQQAAE